MTDRISSFEGLDAWKSVREVRSLSFVMFDTGYLSRDEQTLLQNSTLRTGQLVTGLIRPTESRKP